MTIYVTEPELPPLEELIPMLEDIWKSRVLTNGGQYHKQFEEELCSYLNVQHVSLFCNATIGLIAALKALEIKGEVITTPYSFVATSHALAWNQITPVFVDIDAETLNLDTKLVERAITSNTSAILPVHVYGNPCDSMEIARIASGSNLVTIYDSAHAFGSWDHGRSVADTGDASILSFHATKLFNTFEGGAVISNDVTTKQKIDFLKNFGFENEVSVTATGINGKMNEFSAALGILQLKRINETIARRCELAKYYQLHLNEVSGIRCVLPNGTNPNYSYFPILVQETYPTSRDVLYEKLKMDGIWARRYFYPLISNFPMYQKLRSASTKNLPVANRISSQILCLPLYPRLSKENIKKIIRIIENPTRD